MGSLSNHQITTSLCDDSLQLPLQIYSCIASHLQNFTMDSLRSALQPVTHNLPTPIHDLGVSILGESCYKKLLLDIDIESTECIKLAISKGLGIGIIGASSIIKVPQILKLIKSRSASGISFLSYLLETSAYLISLAYNVRQDTMAGLDHQAQIRRKSTIVRSTGSFVVLVGAWEVVGELSGSLWDFTLVVRLVIVLVLLCHSLRLIDGVGNSDQRSVWDSAEGVAGRADFLIDLETTAEGLMIKCLGPSGVYPWVFCGMKTFFSGCHSMQLCAV